jgi:hypothetical protein
MAVHIIRKRSSQEHVQRMLRSALDDLLPAELDALMQYSSASSPNTSLTTRMNLLPSCEISYLSLSKSSRVPLYHEISGVGWPSTVASKRAVLP